MVMRLVRPLQALLLALLLVAIFVLLLAQGASAATPNDYFFISGIGPTFGPSLSFAGSSPDGVATDSAGNVYVTMPAGVVKFGSSGNWICSYTGDAGYAMGSSYGLDVDGSGYVYVAESGNNRIAVLAPDSGGVNATSYHHVTVYGGPGTGNGQFGFPYDVAVDGSYLYVVEGTNNRVQKLLVNADHSLSYQAKWGANAGDGSAGTGNGEFSHPSGIAADHAGHLFITDGNNHRVQELTTAGAQVTMWGVASPISDPLYLASPNGIAVDARGCVYVSDFTSDTSWIDVFATSGGSYQLTTRVGGWGTADAQFRFPWAMASAPNGYLYVTDTQNNELKRFARDATGPAVAVSGVPAGWARNDVSVSLGAADASVAGQYTSGVAASSPLQISRNSGSTWQDYVAPVAVTAEGQTDIQYRATDGVGNVTTGTVSVRVDKTAPATTATAVPGGWSKKPVTIGFNGSDALSRVARTEYSTNGGASWTTADSVKIGATGETKVQYRSVDVAGNVETAKSATVRIDAVKPLPRAMARCLVFQGRTMRLQYRVIDVCPKAKVTVEVWQGRRRVLTARLGWRSTNASLAYVHKCTLAPGMYTYKVYAKDLAGNVQRTPSVNVLEVMRPR